MGDCTVVVMLAVVVEIEGEAVLLVANVVIADTIGLSGAESEIVVEGASKLTIDGSTDFTGCTAGCTKLLIVGGSNLDDWDKMFTFAGNSAACELLLLYVLASSLVMTEGGLLCST